MERLETDYLIVGAGAMGMAFADVLVTETDATPVIVDRRHQPGGHWNDAYPFVRLHQPSAFYGVNSRKLGSNAIDTTGWNKGLYELATNSDVCAYFGQVMQRQFLPSGRVSYFPLCEYVGDGRNITLQALRTCQQLFSAAFIAHVEATIPDEEEGNQLCSPVLHLDSDIDFLRTSLGNALNQAQWMTSEELTNWLRASRLDVFTPPEEELADIDADSFLGAIGNLQKLLAEVTKQLDERGRD